MGLTAAVRILEALPAAQLTVVAEQVASNTTSEGAAGLWKPFAISGTPAELVNRWGRDTLEHYLRLYQSPEAAATGVLLTPAFELFKDQVPDPEWADVVLNFRHLTSRELVAYGSTGSYSHGWAYDTIVTEGRLYMGWLLQQMQAAGRVQVECRRVTSLDSLASFDAVVNCCGLGARELVGDLSVEAIRGHVLRVEAPWVRHHVEGHGTEADNPNDYAYIIPNSTTVVLGGNKGHGDYDTVPRPADRAAILKRCTAVVPSLAAAQVVGEWVGLRPGRPSVRLEVEQLQVEGRQGLLPCIHNYGHGGSGLTLAWGCATDVVDLLVGALAAK